MVKAVKRTIVGLLASVLLLASTSCDKEPPNGTQLDHQATAYYSMRNIFSEAKTRVLFVNSSVLQYYNKLEGEQYTFCFDPLCNHGILSGCIAHKFGMADTGIQTIEYCEYDNRFYALRGQQFCSFAFDGSDLRIEHSFGEEGKFGNEGDLESLFYSFGSVANLEIKGNYAYLLAPDTKSGRQALMRFDVEKEKMETLFYDDEIRLRGYLIAGDFIYSMLIGEKCNGLYRSDLNFENLERISDDPLLDITSGIFDWEKLYYYRMCMMKNEQGKATRLMEAIVAYDVETGIEEDVVQFEEPVVANILAVAEDYIYYTKKEAVSLGMSAISGEEEFNYYSRIYRVDKETKKTDTIFEDSSFEVSGLYFAEDIVLLSGQICKNANKTVGVIAKSLDEQGFFVEK